MIYFFADDHYGSHPGRTIFEHLDSSLRQEMYFRENDWALLESGEWVLDCKLLILNMIGGTGGQPHPGEGAERALREYCRRGGNILLLHGSSAAFWQWSWWRPLPGLRWVRPGDPDDVAPSTHPKEPYRVTVAKVRHVLAARLTDFELGTDEIYIDLEQTAPVTVLMNTRIEQGTFPQGAEALTPWGGKILSFLPGHKPEAASDPALIANVSALIGYLLE